MRRALAWWYMALAIGFALLAADHILLRDKPVLVVIRLVIAAGFGLLSYSEFRLHRSKR